LIHISVWGSTWNRTLSDWASRGFFLPQQFSWEDRTIWANKGDGNLTQDGGFNYTWDAENRLIEAVTRIEAGQNQYAYESGDKRLFQV